MKNLVKIIFLLALNIFMLSVNSFSQTSNNTANIGPNVVFTNINCSDIENITDCTNSDFLPLALVDLPSLKPKNASSANTFSEEIISICPNAFSINDDCTIKLKNDYVTQAESFAFNEAAFFAYYSGISCPSNSGNPLQLPSNLSSMNKKGHLN